MTDKDKTTMSDVTWKYEVDTAQRAGTTGQTRNRRHGEVFRPEATDGDEPNDQHDEAGEDGSDDFGIPVQFKD